MKDKATQLKYHRMNAEIQKAADGMLRNIRSDRTDSDLLDQLQSLPFQLEIIYKRGLPKSDSAPSLRDQINLFLDLEQHQAA